MLKPHLLIPAAGVGSRMKIGYPKQYMPFVDDRNLLETTVWRLSEMTLFASVAVVVSADDAYIDHCDLPQFVRVLRCGGKTRAQSVYNGLKALELNGDEWVLVHDAARPCVSKQAICRLIERLDLGDVDGAILASPVVDTLKIVNEAGLIEQTVNRELYRSAQTPQGFHVQALIHALADRLQTATDEASAMEAVGAKIAVIDSPVSNIKVTHPDDALLAKFFLQSI